MLGNDVSQPMTLKIEGISKFKGFPGVSKGSKAIQIDQIIPREK